MDKENKKTGHSRRDFFSSLLSKKASGEKIKMLTPDGKLVEVDKSVIEQAVNRKKAGNKDIYDWMKNPSKDQE